MREIFKRATRFQPSVSRTTWKGRHAITVVRKRVTTFGAVILCRGFSTNTVYKPIFTPQIQPVSRLVIPISMSRYDINEKKKKEYDDVLTSLFLHMAGLLKEGRVKSVDVISTAGLQRINWDAKKVQEVESHFFDKHRNILAQQTNCYRWEDWIHEMGKGRFDQYYQKVVQRSKESTEWYDLMVKTYESVKTSTDLSASLEYQRREYAAVMLMSDYDCLVYTGHISLAWAYMYRVIHDLILPIFTRVSFEKSNKNSSPINMADANHTARMILSLIEQTLTSPNFPIDEKQKIINMGMSLFYAYGPRQHKKPLIENKDKPSLKN